MLLKNNSKLRFPKSLKYLRFMSLKKCDSLDSVEFHPNS